MTPAPELAWFLACIDYRDAVLSGDVLAISAAAQARVDAWIAAEIEAGDA